MGFCTRKLAYVLHSLVRVSRRIGRSHFDKISRRTLKPSYSFRSEVRLPGCFSKRFSYSIDFILSFGYEKEIEWVTWQPASQWSTPQIACPSSLFIRHTQIIFFYSFLLNDFTSFNPLFKVLFIFPSQYLFAIGLPSIFSLRRSLSPN